MNGALSVHSAPRNGFAKQKQEDGKWTNARSGLF